MLITAQKRRDLSRLLRPSARLHLCLHGLSHERFALYNPMISFKRGGLFAGCAGCAGATTAFSDSELEEELEEELSAMANVDRARLQVEVDVI